MSSATTPAIEVNNLTYTFPNSTTTGLSSLSLSLPAGSRTVLVGANGAGKTTLLRLLSGKRLAPAGTIRIAGADPFSAPLAGITYLGLEWVLNAVVRTDMGVGELLRSVGGDAFPARRDQLVRLLDVDPRWRMHAVSDGERRRVQLAMGLLRPWAILLLDEVTVDLDVLARSRFLAFLRRETEERGATVVYATHVMDGLADWPTHLVRMTAGRVKAFGETGAMLRAAQPPPEAAPAGVERNSALLELALRWLEEDLEERGPRVKEQEEQEEGGIEAQQSVEAKAYAHMGKIE